MDCYPSPNGLVSPAAISEHGAVYAGDMSTATSDDGRVPHGTALLGRDLDELDLAAAPVLESLDVLLVDGLSDDEDDAFAAALNG